MAISTMISVITLREMINEVKNQALYGETSRSSYKWFFDCGVRTALYSMEAALAKEEVRLLKEGQDGTAT